MVVVKTTTRKKRATRKEDDNFDTHLGTGEVLRGVPLVADHPTPCILLVLCLGRGYIPVGIGFDALVPRRWQHFHRIYECRAEPFRALNLRVSWGV